MKKILSKLGKILPRVALVMVILMAVPILVATLYLNMAMACIVFDPATMPQPLAQMCQEPAAMGTGEGNPSGSESVLNPPPAHAAPAEGRSEGSEADVSPPTAILEIKPGQGLMVDTETKIVNLVDPTGRKYLRIGIVLEYAPTDLTYYTMPPEEQAAFLEEFNSEIEIIRPVINDIIITILSTQTYESVYTAEGKEALRQKIMDTINKQLPEHKVIFVYFTEFVVQ